jgi:hypothetical protein
MRLHAAAGEGCVRRRAARGLAARAAANFPAASRRSPLALARPCTRLSVFSTEARIILPAGTSVADSRAGRGRDFAALTRPVGLQARPRHSAQPWVPSLPSTRWKRTRSSDPFTHTHSLTLTHLSSLPTHLNAILANHLTTVPVLCSVTKLRDQTNSACLYQDGGWAGWSPHCAS